MQIYADILKRNATITASQTPSTVAGGLDPRTPTGIGAYVPGMVHVGIDLDGKIGDPVYAPYDARVWIGTQPGGKWPNGTTYPAAEYLLLTDADGYGLGLYHMDKIEVRSGSVKAGQRIGTIGTKGKSTGPHLHAQVYKAGVCIDAYWYLINKNNPLQEDYQPMKKLEKFNLNDRSAIMVTAGAYVLEDAAKRVLDRVKLLYPDAGIQSKPASGYGRYLVVVGRHKGSLKEAEAIAADIRTVTGIDAVEAWAW